MPFIHRQSGQIGIFGNEVDILNRVKWSSDSVTISAVHFFDWVTYTKIKKNSVSDQYIHKEFLGCPERGRPIHSPHSPIFFNILDDN